MTTETDPSDRLLLEIARTLAELLRAVDRRPATPDKVWRWGEKAAERLDCLMADVANGTSDADAKIALMEERWK